MLSTQKLLNLVFAEFLVVLLPELLLSGAVLGDGLVLPQDVVVLAHFLKSYVFGGWLERVKDIVGFKAVCRHT